MTTVPSIVSGTVTRRASRKVPNWLKAVYAVVATVVAIVALSLAFQPHGVKVGPAEHAAATASRVSGLNCWAEVNHAQPEGYEVICK